MSYAQLGRKTILVDFDLRKKSTFFNNGEDTQLGLSTFLNKRASLHEIIRSTPHEKLHLISSGPVPHNPAELLALDETDTLLKSLRTKYDVVIVDTPPLAQVTDGYLIIESADIVLVVARYNYTKKDVLSIVVKDLRQKNTQNVCLLLNDNKYNRDQYGYGYGYNKKHK
jgi:capsular exopolysaccharide synthesis family protein